MTWLFLQTIALTIKLVKLKINKMIRNLNLSFTMFFLGWIDSEYINRNVEDIKKISSPLVTYCIELSHR